MSLLNQVLRDLDKRNPGELGRLRIPAQVKPLPPAAPSTSASKWIVGGVMLALVVATLAWLATRERHGAPQVQGAALFVVPPRPRVTPDADVVAQALEVERQAAAAASSRESNGRLSSPAISPQTAVAPAARKPEPAVSPDMKPAPKAAPSPQEASGSIKGAPLSHFDDADDTKGKVDITRKNANDEAETRRAVNMMERGQRAEAEAALRQVLAAEPGYQPARSALFRLLAGANRQEEAASLLAEGLRLNDSNTQWAMNLARLQAERDDNASAWETLQRTLPYARLQPDYRAFCGTVLQRLNRPAEAIDHYRAALRARPDEGRWWVGLGLALEADNKPTEARDAFMRAQGTGSLPPELATYVEGKLKK